MYKNKIKKYKALFESKKLFTALARAFISSLLCKKKKRKYR